VHGYIMEAAGKKRSTHRSWHCGHCWGRSSAKTSRVHRQSQGGLPFEVHAIKTLVLHRLQPIVRHKNTCLESLFGCCAPNRACSRWHCESRMAMA